MKVSINNIICYRELKIVCESEFYTQCLNVLKNSTHRSDGLHKATKVYVDRMLDL